MHRLDCADKTVYVDHPAFSYILQIHHEVMAYVQLLEIRSKTPDHTPMLFPFTTHCCELHWIYQLKGTSLIRHKNEKISRKHQLTAPRHRLLYSPQVNATLKATPDEDGHFLLAAVVVEPEWRNWYGRVHQWTDLAPLYKALVDESEQCVRSRSFSIDTGIRNQLDAFFEFPILRDEKLRRLKSKWK